MSLRNATLSLIVLGGLCACGSNASEPGAQPIMSTAGGTVATAPSSVQTPIKSAAGTPATPSTSAPTSSGAAVASAGAGAPAPRPAATPAAGTGSSGVTATAGAAGAAGAAGGGGTSLAGAGGRSGAVAAADGGSGGSGGAAAQATGRGPLTALMYPTTKEKISEQPVFNVTRPKDLAAPGRLLPVVAWANGGCYRSDFTWQPLFDRWAGAGFVVLALTGTGADDDLGSMLSTTTKAEHRALIDWAVKANESGPYAGKLDLSRIVLSGNSCGGVTALQVAAEEKRAALVFVLSGSSAIGSVDKQIMQAISVPVGYVTGSMSEDVAAPNAADDYAALKDGIPAMLVQRKTGDHITVSTDEKILPQDAEIALNWLDLALYGTKQAFDALSAPNVCEHCTPGDWKLQGKHLDTLVK